MSTATTWRTKSYLLMPDASSQMSHATAVHNATMRQTEPRFLANYWNASGPGPHMNDPWQRTGFPKPYLSKHTTFTRSDRFQYGDAFSANRGIRDRVSPGPGRYPPPPSDFDKHVKSKPLLKPAYAHPAKYWITQDFPTRAKSRHG